MLSHYFQDVRIQKRKSKQVGKKCVCVCGGETDRHRMGHTGYLLLCSYLANSGVSVKPAKILEPIINQLNFILQWSKRCNTINKKVSSSLSEWLHWKGLSSRNASEVTADMMQVWDERDFKCAPHCQYRYNKNTV